MTVVRDGHVHSHHSWDTAAAVTMARMCDAARACGIGAIAFTDHADFVRPDGARSSFGAVRPGGVAQLDGYFAEIERCRDLYGDLVVETSMEFGEPHLFPARMEEVMTRWTFDSVLGSVHAVPFQGHLVDVDVLLGQVDATEVMSRYFDSVVALAESTAPITTLAHLEFPLRYWPRGGPEYHPAVFEAQYRATFRGLAERGIALEINSRGPQLGEATLAWFRDEGGTHVSFGSDAHDAATLGGGIAAARALMSGRGWRPCAARTGYFCAPTCGCGAPASP